MHAIPGFHSLIVGFVAPGAHTPWWNSEDAAEHLFLPAAHGSA